MLFEILNELKLRQMKPKKAKKAAKGKYMEKPRLSLIPKEALWEAGKAFGFGEFKYGNSFNYRDGLEISFSIDAALRHIEDFNDGEDFDLESKAHHLGSAISNLSMAVWTYYNKPEMDDRYDKSRNSKVIRKRK